MNNKGQTLGIAILTSIFLIVAGFTLLNFLIPEIDTARINLGCEFPATISDGTKLLCLMTEATIPYYIIIIFSLVIGSIASRLAI